MGVLSGQTVLKNCVSISVVDERKFITEGNCDLF